MPMIFDGPVFYDDKFDGYHDGHELKEPNARARVRLYRKDDDYLTIAVASEIIHVVPCWLSSDVPLMTALVSQLGVDPDTTILVEKSSCGKSFHRYRDSICGVFTESISHNGVESLTGCPVELAPDSCESDPIRFELIAAGKRDIQVIPYRRIEGRRRLPAHHHETMRSGSVVQSFTGSLRHLASHKVMPQFLTGYRIAPGEFLDLTGEYMLDDGRTALVYGAKATVLVEAPTSV
jgi:hypothetical protein